MKRPWIVVAGLALLALVILFFVFQPHSDFKNPGKDQTAENSAQGNGQRGGGRGGRRGGANGPMPVSAAAVEKSDIRITRSALGTITPLATATVRTQIAGQLININFQEGQMVNQGDVLAEVDPQPYQLALQQAEGQLARDQALLKDAQINLERYQKLMAEDSIARQQLDTQKSLVNQYKGVVVADKAQVDNAKLNLSRCQITAPISGRTGLRQIDRGNYVQTGDAGGLVVITQIHPISVVFTLPEDDVSAVMDKMKAGEALEVIALDRANANQLAVGKLTAVDGQIDPATGTVKLRGEFTNEDEKLFPNQFVNVSLLIDVLRDVSVIPAAAVQRGSQGTFVYQVKPDNTVAMLPVKTGVADGDRIQLVEAALNPGDKVVVDGADKLKDGAKVTLPDPNRPERGGQKPERKEPSPASPTAATPPSAFNPSAPGAPAANTPAPTTDGPNTATPPAANENGSRDFRQQQRQ